MVAFALWLLGLSLLGGCGGASVNVRSEGMPRGSVHPGSVVEDPTGALFVSGLQAELHGWKRGDRAILWRPVEVPGATAQQAVAVVAVTQGLRDTARIHVLCQSQPGAVRGLRASPFDPSQQRMWAGRCAGQILERQGPRVRISLGTADQVQVGSRYQVLVLAPLGTKPVALLRVTQVEELSAWALISQGEAEVALGQDVVLHSSAQSEAALQSEPLRILVVNFASTASTSEVLAASHGTAELARALKSAAGDNKALDVQYLPEESVARVASDLEGHARARVLGQRYAADLVVWGEARCLKEACLLPRFTVVDPAKLQRSEVEGPRLPLSQSTDSFHLQGGSAPPQPLELAAAILGRLAFKGQKFADAAFYLQRVLGSTALGEKDAMEAYMNAAYALFVVGQTENARVVARQMEQQGQQRKSAAWRMRALSELARVEMQTGEIDRARETLKKVQELAQAEGDQGQEAYALHVQAMLEAQQGRLPQALSLYQRSLELKRRIGNIQGEAATLNQLAGLEAQQGHLPQALSLHQQSLELKRRIGDVKGEASTLHNQAVLEAQQGRRSQALALYQQSLALWRRIGDVQGEAATLHAQAMLEAQQGRRPQALALYQQSLALWRRTGDVRGEATTLFAQAWLEEQQGRLTQAGDFYQQSLKCWRRIGDVAGRLRTQRNLANVNAKQGHLAEARSQLEQVLHEATGIQDSELQATTLDWLGFVAKAQGDRTEAARLWNQARGFYLQLQMSREVAEVDEKLRTLDAQ